MVRSAHQDHGSDEMKTFNYGYLLIVAGLLISWNSSLVGKVLVSNTPPPDWCFPVFAETNHNIMIIPFVLSSLSVFFAVCIHLKTKSILENLQHQHFKNLPSKNALTFVDTQILFISVTIQVFLVNFPSLLLSFQLLSQEKWIIVRVITHFCLNDVLVCVVFPIYIILKTKKYLPRLWNDSSPIINENNDFYAENPAQVSP